MPLLSLTFTNPHPSMHLFYPFPFNPPPPPSHPLTHVELLVAWRHHWFPPPSLSHGSCAQRFGGDSSREWLYSRRYSCSLRRLYFCFRTWHTSEVCKRWQQFLHVAGLLRQYAEIHNLPISESDLDLKNPFTMPISWHRPFQELLQVCSRGTAFHRSKTNHLDFLFIGLSIFENVFDFAEIFVKKVWKFLLRCVVFDVVDTNISAKPNP